MIEKIKEQIHLGFKGRVIAFILLLFIVYGTIWTLMEPLTIEWITKNPIIWRIILIGTALLITLIAFIFFLPKKILEKFGTNAGDTNLEQSFISTGTPSIKIEIDGFHGKVFVLNNEVSKDEMDWHVKPSANNASYFSFVYLPVSKIYFYMRLILTSKTKDEQKYVWIRLEPTWMIPESYKGPAHDEMAYPTTAINQNTFHKTTVDIKKAVDETFGHGGWQYGKILMFRIRGAGKVKEVTLR